MLLILNKKIEDFCIMTMCVWCIPKNHQKSGLNFRGELGKKSVKRAYLSKIYQKVIKTVSKVYQSYIKTVSKPLQTPPQPKTSSNSI